MPEDLTADARVGCFDLARQDNGQGKTFAGQRYSSPRITGHNPPAFPPLPGRVASWMAKRQKYYVVWKGRKTGIFSSWGEVSAQVKGFPGAEYKAFSSQPEAEAAFAGAYENYRGKKAGQSRLLDVPPPLIPSLAVDAACGGNPGVLEYRCVEVESGREVFYRGPYLHGTNNVGEFLAIVEALMLAKAWKLSWPVYSDSVNALNWVSAKKARTNLAPDSQNAELFALIAKAEAWLRENQYPNRLLKWQTGSWGENPADFGRK